MSGFDGLENRCLSPRRERVFRLACLHENQTRSGSHERTKPVLGGIVPPETAVDIQRILTKLQSSGGGDMGLIVGQPGCGKSQAIRDVKAVNPGAVVYPGAVVCNVTAGEGGAFTAAQTPGSEDSGAVMDNLKVFDTRGKGCQLST